MSSIIAALTASGIPGIIIAALLMWVFRLQTQIDKIQQARIDDAKAFTERALELQEGVHRSVDRLESLHNVLSVRAGRDE